MVDTVQLHHGDCLDVMRLMPEASVDAIVTDPPYGIRFMGIAWDGADIERQTARRRAMASHAPGTGPNGGHKSSSAEAGKYDRSPSAMTAFQEWTTAWACEALRVLKPGAHMLVFASPRTYHRAASGIEDAGFEVRDQIMWLFGSGFPKSMDVSRAIDTAKGMEREVTGYRERSFPGYKNDFSGDTRITAAASAEARRWEGWGTGLKPAHEPVVVARRPLTGNVAANVLEHGTGALNIDGCRIPSGETIMTYGRTDISDTGKRVYGNFAGIAPHQTHGQTFGRFPANVIHDGSHEVMQAFARYSDTENVARFYYCTKASGKDRNEGCGHLQAQPYSHDGHDTPIAGNHHPTVKPTALMAYLCRLVTPPGGVVLDPFMGSGSTGKAAIREGFQFIGIEREAQYVEIARARIEFEQKKIIEQKIAAEHVQVDLFERGENWRTE